MVLSKCMNDISINTCNMHNNRNVHYKSDFCDLAIIMSILLIQYLHNVFIRRKNLHITTIIDRWNEKTLSEGLI